MGRVKMNSQRYNQILKKVEAGLSVVKIADREKCSPFRNSESLALWGSRIRF